MGNGTTPRTLEPLEPDSGRHWVWTFKPCNHVQYETRSPHAYDYCSMCKKWLQTVGQEVSR